MKFTTNSKTIYDLVHNISHSLPKSTTRPILQNVNIEAANGSLKISGTDHETEARVTINDVIIKEEGKALIQGFNFVNVLREIGSADMSAESDEENLVITTDKAHFVLKGTNPEEYSGLEAETTVKEYTVKGKVLLELLRKGSFAANREIKQVATDGALLDLSESTISVISTDGKRLAKGTKKTETIEEAAQVILPQKTCGAILRFFSGDDEIRLKLSENTITVEKENVTFVSRLINGKFPEYSQVIPQDKGTQVTVNKENLLHVLRQVMAMLEGEHIGIYMDVDKNMIRLSSDSVQSGKGESETEAGVTGEAVRKKINSSYLGDVIKAYDSEEVTFEIYQGNMPLKFREGKEFVYLLMPLMETG